MEQVKLRGHHLTPIYEFYCCYGKLGAYTEKLFGSKEILLTDSSEDEICRTCSFPDKRECDSNYRELDYRIAGSFGLIVGEAYPFERIKEIIKEKEKEYKGKRFWERADEKRI